MLLLFDLFYFLLIYFYTSIPKNSLQMICNLPKWWAFLTYDGFKSHVNVTEGIIKLWRRGSGLERRRLGQELSIKLMINSRRIRTKLKQFSSWTWNGGIFMAG